MKTYDILELQRLSKQQIESIAVEFGVSGSMEDQPKQTLIYAILDKQSANKTEQNYFFGLEKYGKVEQNEKKEGKYFIKITEGFNPNAFRTFDLLKSILDQVEEKNLVIEKFSTDHNLYWLILKPKPIIYVLQN